MDDEDSPRPVFFELSAKVLLLEDSLELPVERDKICHFHYTDYF